MRSRETRVRERSLDFQDRVLLDQPFLRHRTANTRSIQTTDRANRDKRLGHYSSILRHRNHHHDQLCLPRYLGKHSRVLG